MSASDCRFALLPDEAATLAAGADLAAILQAPLVLWLQGELGAGKTTLVRGLLRALGHRGAVKSPTYALVESYRPQQTDIHHFDLYRFSHEDEWPDAGLDELFGPHSLCLIEWPGHGGRHVPAADLLLQWQPQTVGRKLILSAHSPAGAACVAQLNSELWQKSPAEPC